VLELLYYRTNDYPSRLEAINNNIPASTSNGICKQGIQNDFAGTVSCLGDALLYEASCHAPIVSIAVGTKSKPKLKLENKSADVLESIWIKSAGQLFQQALTMRQFTSLGVVMHLPSLRHDHCCRNCYSMWSWPTCI
jgi:hypothetical protein